MRNEMQCCAPAALVEHNERKLTRRSPPLKVSDYRSRDLGRGFARFLSLSREKHFRRMIFEWALRRSVLEKYWVFIQCAVCSVFKILFSGIIRQGLFFIFEGLSSGWNYCIDIISPFWGSIRSNHFINSFIISLNFGAYSTTKLFDFL